MDPSQASPDVDRLCARYHPHQLSATEEGPEGEHEHDKIVPHSDVSARCSQHQTIPSSMGEIMMNAEEKGAYVAARPPLPIVAAVGSRVSGPKCPSEPKTVSFVVAAAPYSWL